MEDGISQQPAVTGELENNYKAIKTLSTDAHIELRAFLSLVGSCCINRETEVAISCKKIKAGRNSISAFHLFTEQLQPSSCSFCCSWSLPKELEIALPGLGLTSRLKMVP